MLIIIYINKTTCENDCFNNMYNYNILTPFIFEYYVIALVSGNLISFVREETKSSLKCNCKSTLPILPELRVERERN